MSTAAGVARLCEIKDVTEEDAALIRAVWKAGTWQTLDRIAKARKVTLTSRFTESRRLLIDSILNTCGVEFLGRAKRSGEDVFYCNGGDTYATTVLFVGTRLVVGCIGDYVDSVRHPNDLD